VTRERLAEATYLETDGRPVRGSNAPWFVRVRLPGGGEARVLWKAEDTQDPYFVEGVGGPLHVREVAAARLSEALGFNLVPPTISLTIDGRVGSAQLVVPGVRGGTHEGFFRPDSQHPAANPVQRELLKVFDRIIGNPDRHGDNWLLDGDLPVAIDNGVAFPTLQDRLFVNIDFPKVPTDLGPVTRALLNRADVPRLARVLAETGLEKRAIVGALSRLMELREANGGAPAASPDEIKAWLESSPRPAAPAPRGLASPP
jgi:hypothetical protein